MRLNALDLIQRALLWVLGVGLLVLLILSGQSARLDNLLYDSNQRHWGYPPDDDVVIVAIDPKSVAALGAWPWSRQVHAQLIDRLTQAKVHGIGLDVTTSEADSAHPEHDRQLAEAIRRNGRVVMPVSAEADSLGGLLEEMPPVPPISEAVAALGHVDVDQDPDGVARGVFLRAGLGRPYWPSLALALYRLDQHGALRPESLPGMRDPEPVANSPYQWARDNRVLLRYAGPPGSFGRVSYVDVLRGEVPAQLLKNRWVLIGATATGLGDVIATPTSAGQNLMPGVEYQANLLESLIKGYLITPLGFTAQLGLGALVLALSLLLELLPGFRRVWPAALAAVLVAIACSIALLRGGYLWWPPAASCLVVLFGLALWGLGRLRRKTADGP